MFERIKNFLRMPETLRQIQLEQVKLMAVTQEVRTVLDRLNKATNEIGAKLDRIATQIEEGGMSKQDEADVVTELRGIADRAEGLAADPSNPVPSV